MQIGKGELHGGVETVCVDALHYLVPFQGRAGHGGPPNCAGVVDQHVEVAVGFDGRGDEVFEGGAGGVGGVAGDGEGGAPMMQSVDLVGDGGDG